MLPTYLDLTFAKNSKINCHHELSLRIVQFDKSSTFEELLERDKIFSVYHKNIQSLAIEMYKFVNGLSPEIMSSIFHVKESNKYSLRNVYEPYSLNPKNSKIRYRNNLVFNAKNMVYITSDHKRKHLYIFRQNKIKDRETNI